MGYRQGIRDSANVNSNANVKHDVVLGSDIKFIWNYGSNATVNQHATSTGHSRSSATTPSAR